MRTRARWMWAAAATAALAVACAPKTTSDVEPRMIGHYQSATQLYTGAAEGDLAQVHAVARELMNRESGEGMPDKVLPYVQQLRGFARLAATAPDGAAAARAVAGVGTSCGACHRAMKRGPRYRVITGPPESDNPVATRMMRHRWAADRLWDGLVGPSDESWRGGAAALQDAPLFTDALTQDVEEYEPVTRLAWEVHDVGIRANTAREQSVRGDLYRELLATCAACHQLLGDIGP